MEYKRALTHLFIVSWWLLDGAIGSSWAQLVSIPVRSQSEIRLEFRIDGDQQKFHAGDIIQVQLVFSATEHKQYHIPEDCDYSKYIYNVTPESFVNRQAEVRAGLMASFPNCHGWDSTSDLAEKPLVVNHTLNNRFRMEKPGKYLISVTSTRLGSPITSNTVEVEIVPADPAWEKQQLAKSVALMDNPAGHKAQGCMLLFYLGTAEANLEMARRFKGDDDCAGFFEIGLINAPNRKAVLEQMEAGLSEPDRPVSEGYLRTLALVSLYQQHPDWYSPSFQPPAAGSVGTPQLNSRDNPLSRDTVVRDKEEIPYAELLTAALAQKTPDARAFSLETLIHLDRFFNWLPVPADISSAAREQLPAVLGRLNWSDQRYLLLHDWPEIRSPMMIGPLKDILDNPSIWPASIVLRRLYELSPDEARPYIERELKNQSPRFADDVLGLLPEKELPQLDGVLLTALQNGRRTGLLQRYASPAIARSVRLVLERQMERMDCESEANLLAYMLRVAPSRGQQLLHTAWRMPKPVTCPILHRVAEARMSPEVEREALAALDDPNFNTVRGALETLQNHGSPDSRGSLLQHFQRWRKRWQSHADELETPWPIDLAFFRALSDAQGWFTSPEDFARLVTLCLTDNCKAEAEKEAKLSQSLILFSEAGWDDYEESFSVAQYKQIGAPNDRLNLARLEEKLTYYPKGTVFNLMGPFGNYRLSQRVYGELKTWAVEHGFDVELIRR